MKKKPIMIAAVILIILCVCAGGIYYVTRPETAEGSKEITVEVIHGDETEKEFTYQTDAEYLGEVLLENELVVGTESEYGLYITEVDGEAADDSLQQWWGITKDGEMTSTGADTTPIEDGDHFELTLNEGY